MVAHPLEPKVHTDEEAEEHLFVRRIVVQAVNIHDQNAYDLMTNSKMYVWLSFNFKSGEFFLQKAKMLISEKLKL